MSDPSEQSDIDENFDLKSSTTKHSKLSKRSRKRSAFLKSRSFVAKSENQRVSTAMSRSSRRS